MEPIIKLNRGATKWDIRQKVWDYIESKNLANFPRPVYNRIPNFKGATSACDKLPVMTEFRSSRLVKVNPDKPQERARYVTLTGARAACSTVADLEAFRRTAEVKVDPDKPLEGARLAVLQARKTLLVPTPRLRTGLFNRIVPPQGASSEDLHLCSTSQGVKDFSVPVGLNAKVQVDLVVVGSVAVSEKGEHFTFLGYRIGKGEGFADMEYGMMVSMGAVNSSAVVVTIVHDCQVVDIPEDLIESHDLTVDYILTPTRVIKTECTCPKPQGIIWAKLDASMLERIPILKKLRAIELALGKDVALGMMSQGKERSEDAGAITTLCVCGVPAGLRVTDLKATLCQHGILPLRLNWQETQRRAFLDFTDLDAARAALATLQRLSINGHSMQVGFARSQRSSRPGSRPSRAQGPVKATQVQPSTQEPSQAYECS